MCNFFLYDNNPAGLLAKDIHARCTINDISKSRRIHYLVNAVDVKGRCQLRNAEQCCKYKTKINCGCRHRAASRCQHRVVPSRWRLNLQWNCSQIDWSPTARVSHVMRVTAQFCTSENPQANSRRNAVYSRCDIRTPTNERRRRDYCRSVSAAADEVNKLNVV